MKRGIYAFCFVLLATIVLLSGCISFNGYPNVSGTWQGNNVPQSAPENASFNPAVFSSLIRLTFTDVSANGEIQGSFVNYWSSPDDGDVYVLANGSLTKDGQLNLNFNAMSGDITLASFNLTGTVSGNTMSGSYDFYIAGTLSGHGSWTATRVQDTD